MGEDPESPSNQVGFVKRRWLIRLSVVLAAAAAVASVGLALFFLIRPLVRPLLEFFACLGTPCD